MSGVAATAFRSRTRAGAASRSRTGITPSGAAATQPRPILGSTTPYVREPYFFSDIGRLRIQQVGVGDAAVEWQETDGLFVGRDPAGSPACVLLLNAPARLREARELVASGASR